MARASHPGMPTEAQFAQMFRDGMADMMMGEDEFEHDEFEDGEDEFEEDEGDDDEEEDGGEEAVEID